MSERRSWLLTAPQLGVWLEGLIGSGTSVVAPVEEDGVLLFRAIASAEQAVVGLAGNTRWSPKEFLLPRSEILYRYALDGDLVQLSDPPSITRPQVLFGVRSCDAAGLAHLDEVFLTGRQDCLYADRREHTTVITVACAAAVPECCCTAVGESPVGEHGVDLQLVPMDEGWLARAFTDRGEEAAGAAVAGWSSASPEHLKEVERLERRVADQIGRSPVPREWSRVLEQGFEHPAWDRLAERCLGCSVCAYVCPSCSCFDMNHEADVWRGEQWRSWDACTFALFTRHASGHNPRATQAQRYRQRVLHKFAFLAEGQESFRCVGCGRCLALCPAGLDILESVESAVTAIRGEGADAGG